MKDILENWSNFIIGISFTFLIAEFGYVLAMAIFNRIEPLTSVIIIAIIYRQILGYPGKSLKTVLVYFEINDVFEKFLR